MSNAKKGRKSGSIAVPFLVTIFLGLLIVGGAMFYIYKNFIGNKNDGPGEPPPRNVISTALPEDSHTILLILDERSNDKKVDKECSTTYMIMRSVPHKKHLLFIGVPSNLISVTDDKGEQCLREVYEMGGAGAAKSFLSSALSVDIDRYMVFDSDTFKRVCEIFGNVTYKVDAPISTLKNDGSLQNMSSSQIETYVTYSYFKGGEQDRAFKAANIVRTMINGTTGDRIANNLDRYFEELVNKIGTDINAADYDKRKNAIKYMFQTSSSFALYDVVSGKTSGKKFVPNKSYIANLPIEYFGESEEPTK